MKVKIKTWEQMEKEFGLYDDGEIDCTFIFSEYMEQALPEDRIIDVRISPHEVSSFPVYLSDEPALKYLWFSDDMIEEIIEE